MKEIVAFDLDGTLALSKQPLTDEMAELLAALLNVAQVAVISGGDWPQFEKQVASRMPAHADLSRLWMMPTSGAKLYVHRDGAWTPVYAELFTEAQKQEILEAFDASLEATGFVPEETWASGSRTAAARSPSRRSASRPRSRPRKSGTPISPSAR